MYRHLIVGLLVLMFTGCDLFDPEVDKPEEFTDELRVIPSRGVDEVLYGESFTNVIGILGEPYGGLSTLEGERSCRELTNLKISVFDDNRALITDELYVKVKEVLSAEPPTFQAHFTSVPPASEALFAKLLPTNAFA